MPLVIGRCAEREAPRVANDKRLGGVASGKVCATGSTIGCCGGTSPAAVVAAWPTSIGVGRSVESALESASEVLCSMESTASRSLALASACSASCRAVQPSSVV
eukprot:scaffold322168_cov36-Tisochrysis_lutea.AAC.2